MYFMSINLTCEVTKLRRDIDFIVGRIKESFSPLKCTVSSVSNNHNRISNTRPNA